MMKRNITLFFYWFLKVKYVTLCYPNVLLDATGLVLNLEDHTQTSGILLYFFANTKNIINIKGK